ncbi:MAG: type II toxin-antitoxin system ParD family antitoxin [Pseudomonadota bacterium]
MTEHQETLIRGLVAGGRYQSPDDVVQDGLRMLERREAQDAAKREALRIVAEVGKAALQSNGYAEFSRPDCRFPELRRPLPS